METFAALLGLQRFSTVPWALREKISFDKCIEKPKGFFIKTSVDIDAEGRCCTVIQSSVDFLKGTTFPFGAKSVKAGGAVQKSRDYYPKEASSKQVAVKVAPTPPIDILPSRKVRRCVPRKSPHGSQVKAMQDAKGLLFNDAMSIPVSEPADMVPIENVVKQLQQLFTPTTEAEKKLCRDTMDASRLAAQRFPFDRRQQEALAEIALVLANKGYRMVVRRTRAEPLNYWGGANPGTFCYCVLPGTFTGHVIEPFLKEHFAVVNPTARYLTILNSIPPLFIGPPAQLMSIANVLCSEVEKSFAAHGAAQPPWRAYGATVCRWFSRCYRDLDVPTIAGGGPPAHAAVEQFHASCKAFLAEKPNSQKQLKIKQQQQLKTKQATAAAAGTSRPAAGAACAEQQRGSRCGAAAAEGSAGRGELSSSAIAAVQKQVGFQPMRGIPGTSSASSESESAPSRCTSAPASTDTPSSFAGFVTNHHREGAAAAGRLCGGGGGEGEGGDKCGRGNLPALSSGKMRVMSEVSTAAGAPVPVQGRAVPLSSASATGTGTGTGTNMLRRARSLLTESLQPLPFATHSSVPVAFSASVAVPYSSVAAAATHYSVAGRVRQPPRTATGLRQ